MFLLIHRRFDSMSLFFSISDRNEVGVFWSAVEFMILKRKNKVMKVVGSKGGAASPLAGPESHI